MPPTVFETVDSDTRQAIIHLNQKLKDLQTEIAAKLLAIEEGKEEVLKIQPPQLLKLASEVEQALHGIDTVVNTVISEEMTPDEFLEMHHEELEKFREMVITNTEKIEKINKALS
jgi:hypothetical protein